MGPKLLRHIVFLLPLILPFPASGQQVTGQDLDTVLERADKLLEESKASYEEAREKSSAPGFVDAGFKLEDARIKYIVLQEIGNPEKQKIAAERLRSVNQLAKLIHDGKVAISGAPADPKPAEPPPPPPQPGEAAKPAPAPIKVDISKRVPVPDVTKLKDAEKLIKDLYKEQYAKKTQADRKVLGRLLLAEAPKNRNDQMVYWVLCREAQDQAVQGCDLPTAMKAIDVAGEVFDIDGMALRNAALAATSKTAKTPEESAGVVAASFKSINELVANDQYDAADKLAQAMMPLAKKAGNVLLFTQLTSRAKEIADAKTLYQGMKSVLETLAKTPDDPAGNSEMGKFLCFVKGNWDLGLRFIAKGGDPTLKALAEKELSFPTQASDLVALGDSWFELAEKDRSPLRKSELTSHACVLYQAALPTAEGLLRVKIEKRLASARPPNAPQRSPTVDVIRTIDIKRDLVSGEWDCDGKTLNTTKAPGISRIQLPYEPSGDYELTVVAERKQGTASLYIGLVRESAQFYASIDDWSGTISALGYVDGKNPKDNETAVKGLQLTNNKPATIVCTVKASEITVSVDGNKLVTFNGATSRLSNYAGLSVPNRKALFLGCANSTYSFSQVSVMKLSAQGNK